MPVSRQHNVFKLNYDVHVFDLGLNVRRTIARCQTRVHLAAPAWMNIVLTFGAPRPVRSHAMNRRLQHASPISDHHPRHEPFDLKSNQIMREVYPRVECEGRWIDQYDIQLHVYLKQHPELDGLARTTGKRRGTNCL